MKTSNGWCPSSGVGAPAMSTPDEESELRVRAYDELNDDLEKAAERYAVTLDGEDEGKIILTLAASVVMYAATIARVIGATRPNLERIISGILDEVYGTPGITQHGGDA